MAKKWLTLASKVALSNLGLLRAPFKLTYVLTKECHSRCTHCNIWQQGRSPGELSLEEVEKLAKNSSYLSWIDFTGGEPTDRKDFSIIVKTFLEHCPNLLLVHFPTNGLKPKRIVAATEDILRGQPCRLIVTVSIDGPPETHDNVRGIPKNFERGVECLRALRELKGLSVYAGMTLCSENTHQIENTFRALKDRIPDFRYQDLHINLPHLSSHYYGNISTAPKPDDEMLDALRHYKTKRGLPWGAFRALEWLYQKEIPKYLDTGLCPKDCAALYSSCYLAEDGTVYPCSIWDEPLGNIRDTGYSLLPLLHSEQQKALRKKLLNKECPNCWTPCEAYPTIFSTAARARYWVR